jgi:hypothetical protein
MPQSHEMGYQQMHGVQAKEPSPAVGKNSPGNSEYEALRKGDIRSLAVSGDTQTQRHTSYPREAMIRAHLLRELMGYSTSELHRRLNEDRDEARQLGFFRVPSRTTFGRAWRDRFDEALLRLVERTAEHILTHAHERGNPLGFRSLETEDKSDVSERTEQRHIKEKTLKVSKEMRELLHGTVDLDRPEDGTQYVTSSFLGLESLLCTESCAAEDGSDIYADNAPRGVESPDADTHLHYLKDLEPAEIFNQLSQAIGAQVKAARRHLEFSRPVEIAIDMTYVAYYGARDEIEMVMGAPGTKEYEWCYKFATLTVVGENVKFTLAMRPVQKGDKIGEIVRDLLEDAREHVTVSMVYADSEFCSAEALRVIEEANANYVIPSPKNKRVKREIERMSEDVEVRSEYGIHGMVSSGARRRAETNLVLFPSTSDEETTVAFVTNKSVHAETEVERKYTRGAIDRYGRRWGIENSYKTIKDFLAWTTSKDFSVRLFYFGFAVLLYNMWLLVDLIVQVSLDVEHRLKPRVTAKRFLNLARKQLGTG